MPSPFTIRPEILAPAGTEESFAAALASGADAIYLGLSEGFNARSRSTAFSLENLAQLARRAHAENAKLYLTLNTLVFENELPEVEVLLCAVAASGVDALIIQDPAVALLARRLAPHVRRHASTQMTISSAEGAQFAATLGIERVVLPRELSTKEVALFTQESSLEAEVFVHGALCMAWSGQCLTSEAFSGRSANRGQCSQACRMPYQAIVDGQQRDLGDMRYLLSPRDLAGHDTLEELLAAGVHSLKIEGRYKGPAYVTAAVDSWRNWRDALLRGVTDEDRARLSEDVARTQLTFSRGGSVGFLHGDNHQTLVVATTPKHRGLYLGQVIEKTSRSVIVGSPKDAEGRPHLRPGVGVKFELRGRSDEEHDPENAPGGPLFRVRDLDASRVELGFGTPGPDLSQIRRGDEVRVTGDPEIGRDAERRLTKATKGRIPLALRIEGNAGEPLAIHAEARTSRGLWCFSCQSSSHLAAARSGPGIDRALLENKLGALGGTSFHLAEMNLDAFASGLHLPVQELKQLRRELVEGLGRRVLDVTTSPRAVPSALEEVRCAIALDVTPLEGTAEIIPLCRTEEQLEALIDSGFEHAEVELDWMEMVGLGRAVRRAKEANLRVTLATVRVQKPGEEAFDRRLASLSPSGILVRHWGALMHFSAGCRDEGLSPSDFVVHGDFSLNVTNSLTACHLLGLGLQTVTASHDLNKAQLLDLLGAAPRGRVAVTLHHHIPTFHNSHCVYAHLLSRGTDYKTCGRPCEKHRLALRDYAGHEHPVVVDVSCRNTVFNASAQSAAPLVPQLLELGVRRFRVEFVWESKEDVARTMSAYRALLAGQIGAAETLRIAAVSERYGVTTPLRVHKR